MPEDQDVSRLVEQLLADGKRRVDMFIATQHGLSTRVIAVFFTPPLCSAIGACHED
jgi:hypothetical protein